MKLKHGTVRLDAAAEWLSKTTGRTFTADDLIDAHDRLPIYAVIPESKCNPKHSEPVIREFREKAIEVERLTKSHPRSLGGLAAADAGVPRGLFTPEAIAEVAVRRMRPDIALLHKWEQAAKKQSVYLLSDEDVSILAANGEVRLGRAVSIFNRWIGRPIQFGNPVDVTPDMLAVRRSHLVKYAELVAAEQAGNPAEPVREKEAEPRIDGLQTHQGQAAEMTPTKRAAIIKSLGRRYPALESALGRPEEWAKACRVPDRRGWYYLERIEAECRTRYGAASPAPAADLSPAGQLRNIGR